MVFLSGLLQEHQESILGNTMQSVIALLNNLVAYKGSNMQLLYKQGKLGLEPGPSGRAVGALTINSYWASPSEVAIRLGLTGTQIVGHSGEISLPGDRAVLMLKYF